MSTLLPTEIEESYNNKYKDLLSPENAYQFYLKVQFMIPKMAKKDEATYFYYISYAMKHLSSLNEKESSIALLDLSLANYVKFHNAPENVDTFIKTFKYLYNAVPKKSDKTSFETSFLEYCDKSKIPDEQLTSNKIYEDFANDCIDNEFFVRGYRFSLKTQNIEILNKELTRLFQWEKLKIPELEKVYFIARTTMEILLLKNIPLAKSFIFSHIKTVDNYNFNHPILNFSYLLTNLLSIEDDTVNNYESFTKLKENYEKAIKKEKSIGKYVNKISLLYYKKSSSSESGGFSLFNFLRAFTG